MSGKLSLVSQGLAAGIAASIETQGPQCISSVGSIPFAGAGVALPHPQVRSDFFCLFLCIFLLPIICSCSMCGTPDSHLHAHLHPENVGLHVSTCMFPRLPASGIGHVVALDFLVQEGTNRACCHRGHWLCSERSGICDNMARPRQVANLFKFTSSAHHEGSLDPEIPSSPSTA